MTLCFAICQFDMLGLYFAVIHLLKRNIQRLSFSLLQLIYDLYIKKIKSKISGFVWQGSCLNGQFIWLYLAQLIVLRRFDGLIIKFSLRKLRIVQTLLDIKKHSLLSCNFLRMQVEIKLIGKTFWHWYKTFTGNRYLISCMRLCKWFTIWILESMSELFSISYN